VADAGKEVLAHLAEDSSRQLVEPMASAAAGKGALQHEPHGCAAHGPRYKTLHIRSPETERYPLVLHAFD